MTNHARAAGSVASFTALMALSVFLMVIFTACPSTIQATGITLTVDHSWVNCDDTITVAIDPIPANATLDTLVVTTGGADLATYTLAADGRSMTVTGKAMGDFTFLVRDGNGTDAIQKKMTLTVIGKNYATEPAKKNSWTVMYYSDADCNLEKQMLDDIYEMEAGMSDMDMNLILLVDRAAYVNVGSANSTDSLTLAEDFTGTRLYRILPNGFCRIAGSGNLSSITSTTDTELNMGNAQTLKDFVDYCKAAYPATRYALFLANHGGGGARNIVPGVFGSSVSRSVAYDAANGNDPIFTAELTEVLDQDQSVDLLVFDACNLGTAELAYQYRCNADGTARAAEFSAHYLAASAASVWGPGLPYDGIFRRIAASGDTSTSDPDTTSYSGGGMESIYPATTLTGEEFARLIVEEQYDSTNDPLIISDSKPGQTFFAADLSKMAAVKTAADAMATAMGNVSLSADAKTKFDTIRGEYDSSNAITLLNYMDGDWIAYPYFDLAAIADAVNAQTDAVWSTAKTAASNLKTAVDACMLSSFGNSGYNGYVYSPFSNGTSGMGVFFPDGNFWNYQWWYNPNAIGSALGTEDGIGFYGNLAWCADDRTNADSTVQNWFELLDSWFDDPVAAATGGYNEVQW